MLAEALRLNDAECHGAALKQVYHASEYVATAYLFAVIGQSLSPNDAAYDLFTDTIRDSSHHPALIQGIRETVGKVCALREAY
jgi:hypothetical protein